MLGNFNTVGAPFPFLFKHFGTFAGPQYTTGSYNYDASSTEGIWHTLINSDKGMFTNKDLGAYLYNIPFTMLGSIVTLLQQHR